MENELSTEETGKKEDPVAKELGDHPDEIKEEAKDKMEAFLTYDDLAEEEVGLDLSELLTSQAHPFANYNARIMKTRVYPRNPALEHLQLAELVEYCRVNEFFHPTKMLVTTIKDPEDEHRKIKSIAKHELKKADMLEWIEKCETRTFPTDAVVFCGYRKKKSVPYSRVIYSDVTRGFLDIIFDKVWMTKDRRRPGWFAIVQDYTVRARLIFRFDPKKKGRLVVDNRFKFLGEDKRQLEPLRKVFLLCQQSSKVIQEAGLASSGDKAEKELFGDSLPSYQVT